MDDAIFKRGAIMVLTGLSDTRAWRASLIAILACICLPLACSATRDAPPTSAASPRSQGTGAAASRLHLPPAPEDCLRRAQGTLDAFCEHRQCPGATLGFVLPDGRRGALASGVSNKCAAQAMTPGDRMLLGSIGKTYVATVLLQLVQEGRIDLDSRIARWLHDAEWFPRLPNAHDITVRMLMNHTSGIARYIYTPRFQAAVKARPQKAWRPDELVAFVLDGEPLFAAGQGWSYADTNYILLGMIIERVTGRTYYRELSDRILTPLRLVNTSPSDRADLEGLVSGYASVENILGLPVEVARNGRYAMNPQFEWTGGGLVTTSLDLARWGRALYGGDVLEASGLQQMLNGVETAPGSQRRYGLGAMIRPGEHGLVVGHAGYMPGYVSMMAYYADHDLSVAVQVNTDVGVDLAALETLLDDVAGKLLQR